MLVRPQAHTGMCRAYEPLDITRDVKSEPQNSHATRCYQALMRPVAMMTPDLAMIAEVMLAAEGFREARILAKKTVTLYSLMIQQLSKQVIVHATVYRVGARVNRA